MWAGKSDKRTVEVKEDLAKQFQVKDMGELHYFLGVKITQNQKSGEVWIGQPAYTRSLLRTRSILQRFDMEKAKTASTPVDTSIKLVKATEDSSSVDQQLYQSAVGSLLYLSTGTRPDITYAVSSTCSKV